MKKIYSFLFAAVTVFAAASCQKEVDNTVEAIPAEETFSVTATVGLDTKTALGENGKSTLWTAGDKISVFDLNPAGNNCCFEIATEELPAATAEFKYTGVFMRPDPSTNPDPFLVALYPYQSTALCDFASTYKISGITVPAEQTAKADGFDSAATFALAVGTESTKDDLKFNNLYSLLKFTVATEGVKTVKVEVNSEAKIAGTATVQLAAGQAGITGGALAATGSSSVTLKCEEGFTVGETYYIAVAPVSYTSLTVYLGETVVKTVSTAKTLEANTIYNLGNLSEPEYCKYGLIGAHQGWKWGSDKLTKLYKVEGNLYAVKGIQLQSEGFKFAKMTANDWDNTDPGKDSNSYGVHGNSAGVNYYKYDTENNNKWYEFWTDSDIANKKHNIGVSDFTKKYDIYLYFEDKLSSGYQHFKFTVVEAGAKMPS